jgi:hypothetical protein
MCSSDGHPKIKGHLIAPSVGELAFVLENPVNQFLLFNPLP